MDLINEKTIAQALFKKSPIYFKTSEIEASIERSLQPEEISFSEKLGDKRKKEFRTSRLVVQELLEKMGYAAWPLVPGHERAPQFPNDICGSLTHTKKNCFVALAYKKDIQSIGIDAESKDRLQPKLWSACLTPNEVQTVHTYPIDQQAMIATLIFSAKESFYKYQYPLTHHWVGFMDVEVTLLPQNLENGEFILKTLKPISTLFKANQIFIGNALLANEEIVTAIYSLAP